MEKTVLAEVHNLEKVTSSRKVDEDEEENYAREAVRTTTEKDMVGQWFERLPALNFKEEGFVWASHPEFGSHISWQQIKIPGDAASLPTKDIERQSAFARQRGTLKTISEMANFATAGEDKLQSNLGLEPVKTPDWALAEAPKDSSRASVKTLCSGKCGKF